MGKSAPEPPDPHETSAAQTGTNVATAIANSYLGNVNEVGPNGSINYTQTGSKQFTDPFTHKTYTVPTWTKTTELTPEQQAIYDTNTQTQGNLANLAEQQSGFLQDYLSSPVDLSTDNVNNYINDHFSDDFNKQWGQQQDRLLSRLASQGIGAGSEAYQNAMDQFSTQRGNAYDNLYGNQYDRAVQNLISERNQPINEITALLSGSQVSAPSSPTIQQPTIPTTDNAGLINQNYNQRLGIWQQQQAQTGNILGGLFSLGAGFLA